VYRSGSHNPRNHTGSFGTTESAIAIIPDYIVEQIREQVNIVETIRPHVHLVQRGRNYVGLCPFHKEKTPSFNVSEERNLFKCFGCGRSGDSIAFIQEHLHLDFVEAVRHIATSLGISIPENVSAEEVANAGKREAVLKVLAEAVEFYHGVLYSSDGAPAQNFYKIRNLLPETIEQFSLGASPAAWDIATTYMQQHGFTVDLLVEAGISVQNEDGRVYDRFRGRAMFPIRDHLGRAVGFSGRTLSADPTTAKYINSPQSIVFDKGRILYGLDKARKPIAERGMALLVEGQVDVIAMHQAGFTHCVATSGTAVTPDHVRMIKKYAGTMVLVYDADDAGRKAMQRAIGLALPEGMHVRCATLPTGADPDSFLREHGNKKMEDLIDNAPSWMHYLVEFYASNTVSDNPVQQGRVLRSLLTLIRSIPDALQHPFHVRELAGLFHLPEETLLAELAGTKQPEKPMQQPQTARTPRSPVPTAGKPQPPEILPAERALLTAALTIENGLTDLLNAFNCTDETFISPMAQAVYRRIVVCSDDYPDFRQHLRESAITNSAEDKIIQSILSATGEPSSKWSSFDVDIPEKETARFLRDAIGTMQVYKIDAEIRALKEQTTVAQTESDRKVILHSISKLLQQRFEIITAIQNNTGSALWPDADSASVS